jgi:superfamily I DNA/RNA helicase
MRDAVEWLVDKVDYKKAIGEEVKSEQMRQFKWENVQEFIASMEDFERGTDREGKKEGALQEYLAAMTLQEGWGEQARKGRDENKVTLMTFHSAKGLEFPACFLIGMEDHIIPHEKSLKETGVEEERRLMYVALTRAMKHLTLSMARKRKRMGIEASSTPSRFILEIPKEGLKISNWHDVG